MNETELAAKLAFANGDEQSGLLEKHSALVGGTLAEELKKLCYEAWLANPEQTNRIVSALVSTAKISNDPIVKALAQWSLGVGEILGGQMRTAIEFFDKAERQFLSINKPVAAAETQVGKLYALAMLGLYDEAVECGLRARDFFLHNNETLAAGKIEHNLGNLYQRRDRYDKAEHFLRIAHERFDPRSDAHKLIQIDNSLANALAHQHKFREAEQIYERALDKAKSEKLQITQAEIESNLGHLLLFQGRLDRALQFFESSRRRYALMKMPHQSAIAEQEIADSYLELNLAPESAAIYEKVAKVFAELELNAERGRVLSNFARSCILLGETVKAHELLAESQKIYASERNFIGEATVKLVEAKLYHSEKKHRLTLEKAASAESVFIASNFLSRALHARWLRGESLRLLHANFAAREFLQSALSEADSNFMPQISLRCYTSLGLLESSEGNLEESENYFKRAITLVEELRAPLPAEDFRTAFLADKLMPYNELIRLFLAKGDDESVKKAFLLSENARSRVLLEMLESDFSSLNLAESRQDLKSLMRLETLREELNWLYNRLNRAPLEGDFNAEKSASIQNQIRDRENETLEINRQQKIFANADAFNKTETLDLEKLHNYLGTETALVEFLSFDGQFSAFVVTDEGVKVVNNLGGEAEVISSLEHLRFQIDGMKTDATRRRDSHYERISRTRQILNTLYSQLLKPLEDFIGLRRLVIVPHKSLHYVPFHALFDGFGYVAESREISYAPSAGILKHCLAKRKTSFNRAVLVGVADELTPQVSSEITTLAKIFPDAKILLDEAATIENLKQHSPSAEVVHFACHGKFRPDNPLFSALHLADGWFNVRDAYTLKLDSSLVVLSACETGINSIAVGDELLGLSRGFFSAGASSLVLSLWQVDDATTAALMSVFYEKLRLGLSPAAALRFAQIQIMQTHPHPFFWSPFILVGSF